MIIDTHTHIYDEDTYKSYFDKAKDKIAKVLTIHYKETVDNEGKLREVNLGDLITFAESKNNLYVIGSVDVEADINKQLEKLGNLLKEKKDIWNKALSRLPAFLPL